MLKLHGMRPKALEQLRRALPPAGDHFRRRRGQRGGRHEYLTNG